MRRWVAAVLLLVAGASAPGDVVACAEPSQKTPTLATLGRYVVPPRPVLAARPALQPQPSAPHSPESRGFAGTVAEAAGLGCTTALVVGLSEQIIAEGSCIAPELHVRVPTLANLVLEDGVFPYLQPPAADALARALSAAPPGSPPLRVTSMLRTVAQQYLLQEWFRRGRCGISLASNPGDSNHETGLAIDVGEPGIWRRHFGKHKLRWLGRRDPWHFDYVGVTAQLGKGWSVRAFQRLWNRNHPDDRIREDGRYGAGTATRLRSSPAQGFPIGRSCPPGAM